MLIINCTNTFIRLYVFTLKAFIPRMYCIFIELNERLSQIYCFFLTLFVIYLTKSNAYVYNNNYKLSEDSEKLSNTTLVQY